MVLLHAIEVACVTTVSLLKSADKPWLIPHLYTNVNVFIFQTCLCSRMIRKSVLFRTAPLSVLRSNDAFLRLQLYPFICV